MSVEITIAATRRTRSLNVVENGSAFGDIGVRAGGDAVAIQGFDGSDAGIDVDLGRATEIAATVANAVRADVGIGKCREAAARKNAIGSVDEFLAGGSAVEFIVITTASSDDDCRKEAQ